MTWHHESRRRGGGTHFCDIKYKGVIKIAHSTYVTQGWMVDNSGSNLGDVIYSWSLMLENNST